PLLVAAIFLTTPLVAYILRAANTDLAQASFDMLAVYAFFLGVGGRGSGIGGTALTLSSTPDPRHRLLALSGLCVGLSFSVKYYGFGVGLSLGLALPGWVSVNYAE